MNRRNFIQLAAAGGGAVFMSGLAGWANAAGGADNLHGLRSHQQRSQ